MNEALKRQIKAVVEKARRSLEAAKVLYGKGSFEAASSRAYYAVFHMMQATLLTKELSYSKHSGVISGFSKHFIKSGTFPLEFGKEIRSLRKDREIGDYEYEITISKETAEGDILSAEKIANTIEAYLRKEGWL